MRSRRRPGPWAMRWRRLVCRLRGCNMAEIRDYRKRSILTGTGCTRCLRGEVRELRVGQYPRPRGQHRHQIRRAPEA